MLFETPVLQNIKIEGETLWKLKKIILETKNEISEERHSAEKFKRGTLWDFLKSILLQNFETNEGGQFGAIKKFRKRSQSI